YRRIYPNSHPLKHSDEGASMNLNSAICRCSCFLSIVLGTVFLIGSALACAQESARDPVEALDQVLRNKIHDIGERDRHTTRLLDSLRGLPELRKALMLQSWRDDDLDDNLLKVDRKNRSALATTFRRDVHHALRTGTSLQRLATVQMLAEMGARA